MAMSARHITISVLKFYFIVIVIRKAITKQSFWFYDLDSIKNKTYSAGKPEKLSFFFSL
jgi:hypothetical protein